MEQKIDARNPVLGDSKRMNASNSNGIKIGKCDSHLVYGGE